MEVAERNFAGGGPLIVDCHFDWRYVRRVHWDPITFRVFTHLSGRESEDNFRWVTVVHLAESPTRINEVPQPDKLDERMRSSLSWVKTSLN